MIDTSNDSHIGYGAGRSDAERYEYECMCGKGKIIEENDNIPGFRDHDVYCQCDTCSKIFNFYTSLGVRNWQLIRKNNE